MKKTVIIILSVLILISGAMVILYLIGLNPDDIVKPKEPDILLDVAEVEDMVNYDIGKWDETVATPNKSKEFTFGGYEKDYDKGLSVSCGHNDVGVSGFKVLTKTDKEITLISVGTPICYYHGYGLNNNTKSVEILENFAEENGFINNDYATKVEVLSKKMIDNYLNTDSSYKRFDDKFIKVGNPYWLATASGEYNLWYVTEGGTVATDRVGVYGIRIVVTLKSETLTTGKNSEGVWQLTKK